MGTRGSTSATDDGAEAARLCHDLRQYVASGLILAGTRGAEALDTDTSRRLAAIATVFERIEDLLEQQARGERRSAPVDLTKVAQECVELTALQSTVSVDAVLLSRMEVMANEALLRRAVLNVLNNAARAAGVGGRVRVEIGLHGNDAWLDVSDDGAGFGRIPAVSGLGMGVIEAAIRAAGGCLEIHSGPAPGTRVRLRLPRARATEIRR